MGMSIFKYQKYVFYQYKMLKKEEFNMFLRRGGGQTEARKSSEKRDLFGSGSRLGLIGQDYQGSMHPK